MDRQSHTPERRRQPGRRGHAASVLARPCIPGQLIFLFQRWRGGVMGTYICTPSATQQALGRGRRTDGTGRQGGGGLPEQPCRLGIMTGLDP